MPKYFTDKPKEGSKYKAPRRFFGDVRKKGLLETNYAGGLLTDEEIDKTIKVNARGAFKGMRTRLDEGKKLAASKGVGYGGVDGDGNHIFRDLYPHEKGVGVKAGGKIKKKSGGKVNMPKKRTNKQLGGITRKTLGIAQDKALRERGWDNGNAPTAEESDESKQRRLLAKRRKRATAAKNTEVALEEKGLKLPKGDIRKAAELAVQMMQNPKKKRPRKIIERGKSGGTVKSYATQNKKYGGGVYPKVGNTGG